MPQVLLAMWLGLLPAQRVGADADAPRQAWVVVDGLTVLTEPDDTGYATGTLRQGDRVLVRREEPAGWAVIVPPENAFSWVEESAVEDLGNGLGKLRAPAAVRPGGERAAMPAGTWTVLQRGEMVRLLDLRPLVVRRQGGERQIWLAVRPPKAEVRYVHADGLADWDPSGMPEAHRPGDLAGGSDPFGFLDRASPREPRRHASLASRRLGSVDPTFASVGPPVARIGLAAGFARALDQAEAEHRAVLVLPVEAWRLENVARSYQNLHDAAATAEERSIARSRLDQVARQQTVSAAARQIAEIAERSRRRDGQLAGIRDGIGKAARASESPFDVTGLLHRSSKLLAGRRAYALIDDDGSIAAYLDIPPGLDAERFVAHQVGVRGDARYDETLRERVIWVRNLVPLDEAP